MKNIKATVKGLDKDKVHIILIKKEEATAEMMEKLSKMLEKRGVKVVIMAVDDVNSVSIVEVSQLKIDFESYLVKKLRENGPLREVMKGLNGK